MVNVVKCIGKVCQNCTCFFIVHSPLRMCNYVTTCLYILYASFTTWCQLKTYIEDTSWWTGSVDNIINVISWFFVGWFSGVQHTRNVNIYTRYKVDIWSWQVDKFGKSTVYSLLTRIYFQKKSRDKVDKIHWSTSFIKMYPQCKFLIHIMSRNL